MSAFGGKADLNHHAAECPLIAIGVSFVGQGQHKISAIRWLRITFFSLPGNLFIVVTSWSLSGKVSNYEPG